MFIKRIENFKCEYCGRDVLGNGYTNHCPACLWSKHVDIFPGDRAEVCGGMMEPVGVSQKNGWYTLLHKCTKCGYEKTNVVSRDDDFDLVISIVKRNADKASELL